MKIMRGLRPAPRTPNGASVMCSSNSFACFFSLFILTHWVKQAAHDGIYSILKETLSRPSKAELDKVINLLDTNSYAPLHYAVRGDHRECVQLLLEYGAGM